VRQTLSVVTHVRAYKKFMFGAHTQVSCILRAFSAQVLAALYHSIYR